MTSVRIATKPWFFGRAHHRRAADVDVLDHLVAGGALRHRLRERVEVHHDEVDRADAVFGHRRGVAGVVAQAEQPAVDRRVERLHPAVHHLGEAGVLGHVLHPVAEVAQMPGGAAGRQDLDAVAVERLRQIGQSGLVRHRDQRARDLDRVRHGGLRS